MNITKSVATGAIVMFTAAPVAQAKLNRKHWRVVGRHTATLTAYSPFGCDNSSGGMTTSMGTRVRPGVLATLPGSIPLGRRIYFPQPLPGRRSRFYRVEDHIGWTPFGTFSLDVAVTCDTLSRWTNPRRTYYEIVRR